MTSLETMKRLNKEREAYLRRQRRQHIKGEMKSRGLFVIEGGGENEATYTARGGDGKTHLYAMVSGVLTRIGSQG